MNYFLDVLLDNYANFKGRARRKEYWMFTLIWLLIAMALSLLAAFFDTQEMMTQRAKMPFWGGLLVMFSLLTTLPMLAVTARRLHDVGKSGWFQLISYVPVIGNLYLLYLLIQDGEPGVNKWGPNPKDPLGSEYVSGPIKVNRDEDW